MRSPRRSRSATSQTGRSPMPKTSRSALASSRIERRTCVAPVVVVRDAAQRRLDAAEHDRHVRGTPRGSAARRRWWRGRAGSRCGRPGSTGPRERIFFCAVSLLSIESRLPARDADEQPRPAQRAERLGACASRGWAMMPDAEAAALEEARDQHRPERRVIDVGVAGDDEDVELVPAARVEVGAGGGKKRRGGPRRRQFTRRVRPAQ